MSQPLYSRILLKISGEALMGTQSWGIDPALINQITEDIQTIMGMGVEVGLVVGAGNFFRGVNASEMSVDRVTGDNMGMLCTLLNALPLQSALEQKKIQTRVMSAIPMPAVAEAYIRRRAIRHLEKKRVVIFAAGTGNPFVTTDTAAVMRAAETGCNIVIKATSVDGVYDSDPGKNKDAKRLSHLTMNEVIHRDLKVMDTAAFSIARDSKMPIMVCNMKTRGNIARVICGKGDFSVIET